MRRSGLISVVAAHLVMTGVLWSPPAFAHWCSNIFTSPARLVVKPETTTVNVSASGAELRVYLRNNFPYSLKSVGMRGEADGYTIEAQPASQDVQAGQDVSYVLSISGGAGDVDVSTLNIQVKFRLGSWRDSDDCIAGSEASEAMLIARSEWGENSPSCEGGNQSASLSAAMLADRYPNAKLASGQPTFGRTGIEQLISFFGYRFCYSSGGGWRSGSDDCPPASEGSPWDAIDQFPQNCMRAGVELGIRKAQLGSKLSAARDGAVNALKGGSAQHRCLAAVVGGVLWQGDAAAAFKSGLDGLPAKCKSAGLRALDGSNAASNCAGGQYYEEAACAAAEGIQGNYDPAKSLLMVKAADKEYEYQYYGYMLYLVVGHVRATTGGVPFFPNVGGPVPDMGGPPPPPAKDGSTPPPPGTDGSTPPPPPGTDGAVMPTTDGGHAGGGGNTAAGGCVVAGGSMGALALPLLLLLCLRRRW